MSEQQGREGGRMRSCQTKRGQVLAASIVLVFFLPEFAHAAGDSALPQDASVQCGRRRADLLKPECRALKRARMGLDAESEGRCHVVPGGVMPTCMSHLQQQLDQQEASDLSTARQLLYFVRVGGPRLVYTSDVGEMLTEATARGPANARTLQAVERQLARDRKIRDPRALIHSLNRTACVLVRMANTPAALEHLNEALSIAKRAGDLETTAATLINLGVAQATAGDYSAAIGSNQQALEQYAAFAAHVDDPLPASVSPFSDVRVEALRMMEREAVQVGQEVALLNLSAIDAYTGQYDNAIQAGEAALALYAQADEPKGSAGVLHGLARVYRQMGETAKADDLDRRAALTGPSLVEADNNNGGNRVALRARVSPGATTPVSTAPLTASPLALAQLSPATQYEARRAQARQAEGRKQPEAAIVAWRQSALIADAAGLADGSRNALAQLQRLALANRQDEMSVFYGKRAINEIQHQRGRSASLDRDGRKAVAAQSQPVFEALASTLLGLGRLAEADQVLRLLREDATADYAGGESRMSFDVAERALLDRDRTLIERWRANVDERAAILSAHPSTPTELSAQAIEQSRKSRFDQIEKWLNGAESAPSGRDDALLVQSLLVRVRMMLGPDLLPQKCILEGVDPRATALADRIARLQAALPPLPPLAAQVMTPMQDEAARNAKDGNQQATDRLWCLVQTQLALNIELGSVDPAMARALAGHAPVFSDTDASLLEDGRRRLATLAPTAVVLEYLAGERDLQILVVSPQGFAVREAHVGAATLEDLATRYVAALKTPLEDSQLLALARELHRWLIDPVLLDLQRNQADTLVLSLQGPVRSVPFAALHDGRQWLVERYALALASTATLAGTASGGTRRPWRIAAFGSSRAVPELGLSSMPGVEQELYGVVRDDTQHSHGALPGIMRLDRAFTAQALRDAIAERYPVIHIASHFTLGDSAQTSLLPLGDGSILTLQKLKQDYRFDGVELFTLSACTTAEDYRSAAHQDYEGLAAFVRGQGAESVLATLWNTNDAAAADLMQAFYAAHEQASLSRAKSLQSAQRHLIAGRFVYPYYWAPFVLLGDWR